MDAPRPGHPAAAAPERQPLEPMVCPVLAARVSLAGRGWVGGRAPDPLLSGLLGGAGGVAPVSSVPDGQTNRQTALIDYLKAHPDATRDQTRADGYTFDNDDFGLLKKAIRRGLV